MRIHLLLCIAIAFISSVATGQDLQSPDRRETINDLFVKQIGAAAEIFSGPDYVPQNYRKTGSVFYASDSLAVGWIVYDGLLYKNVGLQWDILQNYVLIQGKNGYSRIILRNNMVDSFQLSGHTIIRMEADKESNLHNTDFYDAVYRGKIQVWARRKVTTNYGNSESRVVYAMRPQHKFYIKKENLFYQVTNRREVLNVFSNKQSEINKAVNSENLSWRRDFEECLTLAAAVYDKTN